MYYDEIASGYDELHREEQIKKIKVILNNIKINKKDKVLDVGCGPCYLAEFIDCDYTGIDPSEKLLNLNKNKKIKKIIGVAENLPFPDHYFDVVFSITAIHNFKDLEKGISEIKRVGKKRFVFSILKKSKNFEKIKRIIKNNFKVKKEIDEGVDLVLII